jgi:hypothetical protein
MSKGQGFDIPQELRQLAEENVERARQLYLQFMDGVARNMALWSAPGSDAATPGFDAVRERAVKLAKENADAAFALAKEVAQAKDLQELLDLQARYVQSQMKWYADQTQEFGQLMIKALGGMKAPQTPRQTSASAQRPDSRGAPKSSPKL